MPESLESRRRWIRRTALLCVALMLAVTTLSAFVRLANVGPGCEPWPECYLERPGITERHEAAVAARGQPLEESRAVEVARGAHRASAVTVLLVVIALIGLSLGPQPYLRDEGIHALALLALAVFLTVLGRWSSGMQVPAVTLGNLLAGFLMVALSWRLAFPPAPGPLPERLRQFAWLALGLLLLQITLGALRFPLHGLSAMLVLAVLAPFAFMLWRHGERGVALAILGLLAVQFSLGLIQFAAGLPVGLVLLHNIVAVLLLAATASVLRLPLLDAVRGYSATTR